MPTQPFRWTAAADAVLAELYGTVPLDEIAARLGCALKTVRFHVHVAALNVPLARRAAESQTRWAAWRERERRRKRTGAATPYGAFLAPRVFLYAARFEAGLDPLTGRPLPRELLAELRCT